MWRGVDEAGERLTRQRLGEALRRTLEDEAGASVPSAVSGRRGGDARSRTPGRPEHAGAALPVAQLPRPLRVATNCLVGADQAATSRRAGPRDQVQVEPVGRRHGVENETQPIAAGEAGRAQRTGIKPHLGAPVGDRRAAVERQQMMPPRHRRRDCQPADMEPRQIEVDVGKEGRVRIARAEPRRAIEPRFGDVEILYLDPPADQIGDGR